MIAAFKQPSLMISGWTFALMLHSPERFSRLGRIQRKLTVWILVHSPFLWAEWLIVAFLWAPVRGFQSLIRWLVLVGIVPLVTALESFVRGLSGRVSSILYDRLVRVLRRNVSGIHVSVQHDSVDTSIVRRVDCNECLWPKEKVTILHLTLPLRRSNLTLSLPRVIKFKFLLQARQKYYITQYEEPGFS